MTRSVTGDDMAIFHDSYDGLMRVTVLSQEARDSEPVTNETWAQCPMCNVTTIGDIKCDGDFLAHNKYRKYHITANTKQIAKHIIFIFDAFVWAHLLTKMLI